MKAIAEKWRKLCAFYKGITYIKLINNSNELFRTGQNMMLRVELAKLWLSLMGYLTGLEKLEFQIG